MKLTALTAATVAATLAGIALTAAPASAEAIPDGSYRDSCRNIEVRDDGHTLAAECRKMSGGWVKNSIPNIEGCVGDITNNDGWLKCARQPASEMAVKGSWYKSCGGYWLRPDGVLKAHCRTGRKGGGWMRETQIQTRNCASPIRNFHGHLDCLRQDESLFPQGSYRDTCYALELGEAEMRGICLGRGGEHVRTKVAHVTCASAIWNDNGSLTCKEMIQLAPKSKTSAKMKTGAEPKTPPLAVGARSQSVEAPAQGKLRRSTKSVPLGKMTPVEAAKQRRLMLKTGKFPTAKTQRPRLKVIDRTPKLKATTGAPSKKTLKK